MLCGPLLGRDFAHALQVKGWSIGAVTTPDESSNIPDLPETKLLNRPTNGLHETQMEEMNQHQLVNLQPS